MHLDNIDLDFLILISWVIKGIVGASPIRSGEFLLYLVYTLHTQVGQCKHE